MKETKINPEKVEKNVKRIYDELIKLEEETKRFLKYTELEFFSSYNPFILSTLWRCKITAHPDIVEHPSGKNYFTIEEICYDDSFFRNLKGYLPYLVTPGGISVRDLKEYVKYSAIFYFLKAIERGDIEEGEINPELLKLLDDPELENLDIKDVKMRISKLREKFKFLKNTADRDKGFYFGKINYYAKKLLKKINTYTPDENQFYLFASQHKDMGFNISKEEAKNICESVNELMKGISKKILKKHISFLELLFNEICVEDKKFEGDIEELSRSLHKKLDSKYKVFELDVVESEDLETLPDIKFLPINNNEIPTFEDIGGYSTAKEILKGWTPENSEVKLVSLVGTPGTGKTSLALAKLYEYAKKGNTGIFVKRFFSDYNTPEKFKEKVLNTFKNRNILVLLDDAEELIKGYSRRETLALLEEMKKSKIPAIATFNTPQIYADEAIYGRLGLLAYFDLPDEKERKEIIQIKAGKYNFELSSDQISKLAKETEGFSGRFIEMAFIYAKEIGNADPYENLQKGIELVRKNVIKPLKKYQGNYLVEEREEEPYYQ